MSLIWFVTLCTSEGDTKTAAMLTVTLCKSFAVKGFWFQLEGLLHKDWANNGYFGTGAAFCAL